MPERDDHQLLAEFVRNRSEAAFTELVRRYAGLVYATALRFCSNPHQAEEITQAVFVILARKAGTLSSRVVVSGWLYQTARLTAANFVKGEIRRRRREQEAYMQSTLNEPETAVWDRIAPLLDEAMIRLGETDRNAVVLRYFENRTSLEIGAALRMNEETARKRVNRALEKLRRFFVKRGVTLSGAALSGAISANSIQPVSAAMVKSMAAVALAKGATTSISTLTLVKGALKIMACTKAKTVIVVGATIILAAGTATVTIKKISENGDAFQLTQEGWQLLQAGRRPEATAKFNQAVKSDPKSADAWNGLGWACFNSGKTQDAEQTFQKVLSLDPNHPAALNGLGQLYLSQKKYDEAEAYLLKAASSAPAAWFGLARLYLLQGKFDQAEEWARKVVDSGQGDDTAKMMLQAAQDKQMSARLRTMLEPR